MIDKINNPLFYHSDKTVSLIIYRSQELEVINFSPIKEDHRQEEAKLLDLRHQKKRVLGKKLLEMKVMKR